MSLEPIVERERVESSRLNPTKPPKEKQLARNTMNALLRPFARLLTRPEFVLPGLLMLCLGIGFGISAVLWDHDLGYWLIAVLTLGAGIMLLLKTRVGTALLIATVVLNLCDSASGFGWSRYGFPGLALGLAFTAAMVLCALMQFQFHKGRVSRPADVFVLPPRP